MEIQWYQVLIALFGSGILIAAISAIWKASKRDAKVDELIKNLEKNSSEVMKLEKRWEDHDDELSHKIGSSEKRVNFLEKDLIEIKANQKNLIHSINAQNKQILDLIDRLEKNYEGMVNNQKVINEKLELSIDAIKNTLISSGHSNCLFYNKGFKEIKDILGKV